VFIYHFYYCTIICVTSPIGAPEKKNLLNNVHKEVFSIKENGQEGNKQQDKQIYVRDRISWASLKSLDLKKTLRTSSSFSDSKRYWQRCVYEYKAMSFIKS
jgi:hypothetical protein